MKKQQQIQKKNNYDTKVDLFEKTNTKVDLLDKTDTKVDLFKKN